MARIVCISNRVSLPDPETGEIKAGGLAVGVKAAMESNGGGVWFGWDGSVHDSDQGVTRPVKQTIQDDLTFLTLSLTRTEYDEYYKGMANQNLWPLMHELSANLDPLPNVYQTYKDVNRLFAKTLLPHLRPDDVIWVHDYHLIPLGKELRALHVHNKIAFYNHIPMPSRSFIESVCVPAFLQRQYKELQTDLFYYDQVGFQSCRDYENFMGSIRLPTEKPKRFRSQSISGSPTRFGVFPISIETNTIRHAVCDNDNKIMNGGHSHHYKTLLGAERLDYTKGLWHRMEGYYQFLQRHPELQKKVQYQQITPLSRSDITQYKNTIEKTRKAVRKIQNTFSSSHWDPIAYSEDGLPREQLLEQMHEADIGLVTPLIDGQNLVAKEYLAVQDSDNPGVLILSQNAGAAEELEMLGVLCVDPEDAQDIAAKIYQALSLSCEDRQEIHEKCLSHLTKYDISHWSNAFLSRLQSPRLCSVS